MYDNTVNEPYVTITWVPQDLVNQYGFDEDVAMELLDRIAETLHDRSIEFGWEVINDLLNSEGVLE